MVHISWDLAALTLGIQRKMKSEKNSKSNKYAVAGYEPFAMLLLTSVIPCDKWYRGYVSLLCSVCTIYMLLYLFSFYFYKEKIKDARI